MAGIDNIGVRWELKDRMFSEERMCNFVKTVAENKNMTETLKALPYAIKMHEGQTRKGKDGIPYIYHPLMVACHGLDLGFEEDYLIATALLHDTVEDCGVKSSELPVCQEIKEAVQLLTFEKNPSMSRTEAKKIYYDSIAKNRLATIVKVLDRCNNISTMATSFSHEKMAEYIDETEKMVMPIVDVMKYEYPECYNAAFLLKYQMRSIIESLKRTV